MSGLSILIPVYNEEEFIATILERVRVAPLPEGMERELVVVDDASRDGSAALIEAFAARYPGLVRFVRHEVNQGKGAAIRTAIQHARLEFSIIQDADLEYDPKEYPQMLRPLLEGKADVVYGSRFLVSGERRVLYYWHSIANWILTTMCNVVSDLNLTDMETCYKAFRTTLMQSIPIRSNRFGIEPEITIKFAQRQVRIYETPISYHGRTYEEGKKIGLWDAFDALGVILKFGWKRDIYADPDQEILDAFSHTPRFNRWMADTVRPYVGSTVLELGAGIGNLTRNLIQKKKRYIATDLSPEYLARLRAAFQHRPTFETAVVDLERPEDFVAFRDSVETVVCFNVVEHIENDLLALRNIYSAIQPGGTAIILVPHGQEIFGTLDEVLHHYRRYSRAQLNTVMQQAGFTVERIIDFNRASRPGWYVTGRILRRRYISRFQLAIFERLVGLLRRLDPLLPWPPTSVIAIGRKPRA